MIMVVGQGYGGLEHRSSCSLLCSRSDLPREGQETISDEYRSLLSLCSHEYFHTWNIKRIKPACFVPYDLRQESYTQQLWAFEGITSYYDDLTLLRCGLITTEEYLQTLGESTTRLLRGSGRQKQSVADSSFDAWTKFYRQDENAPNAIVNYYTKGSLIALALDLTIRRASNGVCSLDTLMQQLWRDYGKTGIGLPEGEIEALAANIAGRSLDHFFKLYLYGTEELPLAELLEHFGINLHLRAAESVSDKGGKKATISDDALNRRATIGARLSPNSTKFANIYDNGSAQAAGVAAGDCPIAINNIRVNGNDFEQLISSYKVGETIHLHVFRRDELMEFDVALQSPPLNTCEYRLIDDVDSSTQNRRNHWLKSTYET